MKIMVIGSGGREHAICKKLVESTRKPKVFCAPGNAGTAEIADNINIGVTEFDKIIEFCLAEAIDLVFVAPDDPLALGLVDRLTENGIRAFGPKANAAVIEASKSFSKDFMKRHNIPTASCEVFDSFDEAVNYVSSARHPLVIKADGLALGKGVIICENLCDSKKALTDMMLGKVFGKAGSKVVIEEFLVGTELTVLAFTDGKTVKCMPSSQDHKKAFDGDKGLNTGGMGAFSPSKVYTPSLEREIYERIAMPTVKGLAEEGRTFKGVIYFGLMLTNGGIKVIEYNARFGDPEAEVVLPLLKTDFLDIIDAVIGGTLDAVNIEWDDRCSLCVILASGGYPGKVVKGYEITVKDLTGEVSLIHCGTKKENGITVTNGGRVMCLVAVADTMEQAREKVYSQISKVSFTDMRYRTDIGIKKNQ